MLIDRLAVEQKKKSGANINTNESNGMSTGPAKLLVPLGMFSLGLATGFVFRDELNMPTYMRIKMALVEHSILTRKKLNSDVLAVIDPNQGKVRLMRQHQETLEEHERMLKEANAANPTDNQPQVTVEASSKPTDETLQTA